MDDDLGSADTLQPCVSEGDMAQAEPFDDVEECSVEGDPAGSEVAERQAVRREKLIAALASGRSDAEAAEFAHCSTRTIRRLRQERKFRHEVSARRSEHLATEAGQLIGSAGLARAAIIECLSSDVEGVRLRAADLLLRVAERLHQVGEADTDADFLVLQAKYEAAVEQAKMLRKLLGIEEEP
jgi:hypothetical protein